MLFATGTLAKRIEDAESTLIAHFGRAAGTRPGEDPVVITGIGGGTAVIARPGAPFCKVSGLGFEAIDESVLDGLEREFARRQMPIRVELASLGDPAVGALLTRRGYVLSGFENVLGLPLEDGPDKAGPHATPSSVSVTRSAAADARQWLDIVATGFAHPDVFDGPPPTEAFDRREIDRSLEDIRNVEGMVRYLATRDGHVAGGGTMRTWNGIAQLCGAATLPADRRHGVQTALLRARLADARREGCDVAVVTTEPGSRSQENVQRQGFELLYARAILIKESHL